MGEPDRRAGPPPPPDRWTGRVVQVLASSTGGVGTHVADLTGGLLAVGAAVTVCGPATTDGQFGFSAAGATFRPVEVPARPGPADTGAVAALRRAVTGAAPDVIHAHGLRAGLVAVFARGAGGRRRSGTDSGRARRGAGAPGRRPLVVTLHNAVLATGVRGVAARTAERTVVRAADLVLGASEDLVARARALGAADVRLSPVAAPPRPPATRSRAAVLTELGFPPETPLVVSVGRLAPQKAYDVLVAAATRWRDRTPSPQVVIAGNGPSYLELTAQISRHRAPVTLLGHRRDVSDLLAAADVAVVTSRWEARQLFAQEALRAGVPLVATDVGGLPGLVGDAAVLVPPGDVDALDAAVRRLLDDPAARARFAAAGRERAAGWPTPEQTVADVVGAYRELARVPAPEA